MEILCPNCQRKLTIMEQYAGQMMKCPLCANTFTAPALPSGPLVPPAPAPQPAPPPPPAATGSPPPAASAPPQEPVPTEHTGRFSVWISPRCTQYVPVAALFLIFVLSFFPWVGFYPGGVWVDSQNAWQAVFNSVSSDKESKMSLTDKPKPADPNDPGGPIDPGFGVLLLFYLLTWLANFVLAVAVVGLSFVQRFLPPVIQQYARWRWPALAVVTLASFAFLLLFDMRGFPFEQWAHADFEKKIEREDKKIAEAEKTLNKQRSESEVAQAKKIQAIIRGELYQSVVQTRWYRWAFWLHFWALVFVVVTMLAELRAPRPCPRVDLVW